MKKSTVSATLILLFALGSISCTSITPTGAPSKTGWHDPENQHIRAITTEQIKSKMVQDALRHNSGV